MTSGLALHLSCGWPVRHILVPHDSVSTPFRAAAGKA